MAKFIVKYLLNLSNNIINSFEVKELMEKAPDADVLIAFPFFPPELVDYCKQDSNLKLVHSVI